MEPRVRQKAVRAAGPAKPPIAATVSDDCDHIGRLGVDIVDHSLGHQTMQSGALGLISKVSSRFFHEVMPVVLASVIGTVMVNHYSRQPALPSIVVQAPAPQEGVDALLKTLHDEHDLIVDTLKRDAGPKRPEADRQRVTQPGAAPPLAETRSAKAGLALAAKPWPLPPPRPAPQKDPSAGEPLALVPEATAFPSPASHSAPAQPADDPPAGWLGRRPGVVHAFRDFVINVALLPARALEERLPDGVPKPPLPVLDGGLAIWRPN
jgi:hypothetical protein